MEISHGVYRALWIVTFVFCFSGFLLETKTTWEKFWNEATLVMTSRNNHSQLPLPVFAICNYSAFKNVSEELLHEEGFIRLTRD